MMHDLIDRQAAIDAVVKYSKWLWEKFHETCHVAGVTDTLRDVPPAQQWIPCSKRLPEENGRYLTTNSSWGYFEVDWNAWINGEWLYPNENPIAWMPMPKPWKGEEDATD